MITHVAGSIVHRIAQRFPTKPSCAENAVDRTSPRRTAALTVTISLNALVMARAQAIEMSALLKVDQYVSCESGTRFRNSLLSRGSTCRYPL